MTSSLSLATAQRAATEEGFNFFAAPQKEDLAVLVQLNTLFTEKNVVLLSGGTVSLAMEYAKHSQKYYSGVFCLNGNSPEPLDQFSRMQDFLLIYENVTDPSIIPLMPSGHTLIIGPNLANPDIQLESLTEEKIAQYLGEQIATPVRLSSAISHAVPVQTTNEFPQRIKEKKIQISISYSSNSSQIFANKVKDAFKTLDIPLFKNERDYTLCLIDDTYLKSVNSIHEVLTFMEDPNWKKRLFPIVLPGTVFNNEDAIAAYQNYWTKEADRFKRTLGWNASETKIAQEAARKIESFLRFVNQIQPDPIDVHLRTEFTYIFSYMLSQLETLNLESHINLGNEMKDKGNFTEAKTHYEKGLKLAIEYYGTEDHLTVAGIYNDLGNVLSHEKDLLGAKRCHENALKIRILLCGTDNQGSLADSYSNLGMILRTQGDLTRAKEYCEKALKIYKDENSPRIGQIYNNLGLVLKAEGDLKGAKEAFENALACYGNETHESVAKSNMNLGNTCLALNLTRQARNSFLKAKQIDSHIYGTTYNEFYDEKIRECNNPAKKVTVASDFNSIFSDDEGSSNSSNRKEKKKCIIC